MEQGAVTEGFAAFGGGFPRNVALVECDRRQRQFFQLGSTDSAATMVFVVRAVVDDAIGDLTSSGRT